MHRGSGIAATGEMGLEGLDGGGDLGVVRKEECGGGEEDQEFEELRGHGYLLG